MGYLKGFAVIAQLGSLAEQAALASTNSQLQLNAQTEDVTTKEDVSNGVLYPNNEVQNISGTLTMEGYIKDGTTDTLGTLDIGQSVECEFTSGVRVYSFTGLITDLTFTGDKDAVAGYSLTIQSQGEITKSAVSSGTGT